jgi:hypothetical protein
VTLKRSASALIVGGLAALAFAVKAEGKPPEDVARPLSVIARSAEAVLHPGSHVGPPPLPKDSA